MALLALSFFVTAIHPAFAVPDLQAQVAAEAQTAAGKQQWEAAAASNEKAIHLAPNNVKLRLELGAVLTKLGRLSDAIAAYREALRIAPRNVAAEVGLAQAYRNVPNFEEAKRILESSSREHPGAPEPLATLGDIEIQLQTFDAAITHLKAALKLAPANVANRNLLAAAYKSRGDTAEALTELQKALKLDSKNALALYLRSEIHADQTRDELALADARKVVELQPNNRRGRILLGKILLRSPAGESATAIAERCKAAVAALRPLETEASESETFFLLSRAYRCAGQTDEADRMVAAFETASQNDRNTKESEAQSRHLVEEANDAALKNDRAQAIDLANQALARNPNDGTAYSLLAKIYYSSGQIDEADAAITKALERDPYHPDFLYVRGKILEKRGKWDEALAAFTQTTLVNPKESDAYFEIGSIYQQRAQMTRALAAYKKAVELSPDDADYRRALASVTLASPHQ